MFDLKDLGIYWYGEGFLKDLNEAMKRQVIYYQDKDVTVNKESVKINIQEQVNKAIKYLR